MTPAQPAPGKPRCINREVVLGQFNMCQALCHAARTVSIAILLSLVVSGCNREKIAVYRVPKDDQPVVHVQNRHGTSAASLNTAKAVPANPSWTVPAGWVELPPTQLALARFVVSEPVGQAQITVTVLPGNAGGLLANVNRWRAQVYLGPMTEAELEHAVGKLETQIGTATLVELTGSLPDTGCQVRLLGVVLEHGGNTWFFKMIGQADVVARQKDAFLQFVQTTRLDPR